MQIKNLGKNFPLLLILALLIFSVGLYVGKNKTVNTNQLPIQSSTISASTDETTNWKTYIDVKQKYSIKYPMTWKVFPNAIGKSGENDFSTTIIRSSDKADPYGESLAVKGEVGIAIGVVGTDKSSEETLLNYYKRKFSSPDIGGNDYSETIFNGISAIKHVKGKTEADPGQVKYLINNDNWVYGIQVSVHNSQYSKIADQILSTFKFLDQNQTNETASWKTYTNTKYGYSLSYPQELKLKLGVSGLGGEEDKLETTRSLALESEISPPKGLNMFITANNTSYKTVDEYSNDIGKTKPSSEPAIILSKEKTSLTGEKAIKYTQGLMGQGIVLNIVTIKNSNIYRFSLTFSDNNPENISTFNKILSTVKFTK